MKKANPSTEEKKALRINWIKPTAFRIPIPRDEKKRLAALHRYNILDTSPEKTFNSIVLLASHVCNTPIALLVLIDKDRQWFKARVGVRIKQTPREFAFCAYTIMQRALFILPDAAQDKRFAANPLVVSGPQYRFYAGAPLVTPDNRALGSLCVIDKVRRTLTAEQKKDLLALSLLAMTELELRRRLYAKGE
jgi:GAF domain-containing protein